MRVVALHECCVDNPYSDVAVKVRRLFHNEIVVASATKRCPPYLYRFLVFFTASIPIDTQYVDGDERLRMCHIAPSMHLPLASDRLHLKKCD